MENIEQENWGERLPHPETSLSPPEPYSPNNPHWNSWIAFFYWGFSVLLIVFVPMIFLTPYLVNQQANFASREELAKFVLNDPTAIMINIGAIIPAHIVTLIIGWFIVTRYKTYSFKEMLGWKWGGFKWWHSIVLLLSVFAMGIATTSIFGQQDNELLRILRSSRSVVFLVAFMATFSAPIVEEVVYRGVLYSAFQKTFGVGIAVGLVTLVFALVHFPQYWGDYSTLITLTFLSLVITLIRVKTDNLLPCILFHFLVNGIQSVLLILQPYLPGVLDGTKPAEAFFFL